MPYEINFDTVPGGYAVTNAKPGDEVAVQVMEFTSTDDGLHFLNRLEGIPNLILSLVSKQKLIVPSQVDHILAVIRPDATATVYINEIPLRVMARSAKDLQKGELVYKDDIVEIAELELNGIDIPIDCGVVFMVSIGWRKGLYYDFGPLGHPKEHRTYNIRVTLGQIIGYLLFQERFRISDEQWVKFIENKWYPFIGLGTDMIGKMLSHINAGWDLDELTDGIASKLLIDLDRYLSAWKINPVFEPHKEIIEQAISRYRAVDYISSVGLIYPRIEGLMRSYYFLTGGIGHPKSTDLSKTAILGRPDSSVVIPNRFEQYLNEVYFKHFTPDNVTDDISRHSVSHGMASATSFNKKAATIGLLIVHQLGFAFNPMKA